MTTRLGPKKVRHACQRCRLRRIKCDGQLPSCSNCTKTGEECLDADSSNSGLLIPRNFTSEARTRIQWLEEIIRTRLPDVDLNAGPQLDRTAGIPKSPSVIPSTASISSEGRKRRQSTGNTRSQSSHPGHPQSTSPEYDKGFAERAHSVAVDLGMITLNSDSSQKHYLGSSSGLLFTTLIGASPSSMHSHSSISHDSHDAIWTDDPAQYPQSSSEKKYQSLYKKLREELPPREEALALTHTYIQSIHPDFPVLDPESLLSALDALYTSPSYASETQEFPKGWPKQLPAFKWNKKIVDIGLDDTDIPPMASVAFLIFTIFNLAAIIKVRRRLYGSAPDRYYQSSMIFAPECFSQVSLYTVQALIMLIIHCIHTPADANLWTLIHIGMSYCIELGLHRDHPEDDEHTKELNQLVFYTMYGLDRSISSIQGRPLGFRDECFDVQVPRIPEVVVSNGEPSIPWLTAGIIRYAHHNFKLQQIVSSIKTQLYHHGDRSESAWAEDPLLVQQKINSRLKSWWESVFDDGFNIQGVDGRYLRVWRLKLRIRYHTAKVLLFQPSQVIQHPSDDSLHIVFDSATSILDDYQLLHDSSNLDYGWRTVQNTFSAGAALIYSFWMSRAVQNQTNAMGISKTLRICTSLLSIGGEWWPSAKASLSNFGAVVDLTIQRTHSMPRRHKQQRLAMSTIRPSDAGHMNQVVGEIPAGLAPTMPNVPSFGALVSGPTVAPIAAGYSSQNWPMVDGGNTDHLPSNLHMTSVHPLDLRDSPSYDNTEAEYFPEIEHFFADFDRSDFSWSVPMTEAERTADFGPILP